jgi:hypothetical protein
MDRRQQVASTSSVERTTDVPIASDRRHTPPGFEKPLCRMRPFEPLSAKDVCTLEPVIGVVNSLSIG